MLDFFQFLSLNNSEQLVKFLKKPQKSECQCHCHHENHKEKISVRSNELIFIHMLIMF